MKKNGSNRPKTGDDEKPIDPSVVKAMCRASREAYGFTAPRTFENKKKYKRSRDKKIKGE